MRYKLPEGSTNVSVLGVEFVADDDGYITVSNDGSQAVHIAIQDAEHGLGLVAEPDKPSGPGGAAKPVVRGDKAGILAELAGYGVRVDGRRSIEELRETLDEARKDAETARQAAETEQTEADKRDLAAVPEIRRAEAEALAAATAPPPEPLVRNPPAA